MNQKNLIDLFTVDLNYDSLRDFIGEMTKIINYQGRTIQEIQTQVKNLATKDQISQSYKQISECIEYQDPQLKQLSSSAQNSCELTGDDFVDNLSILTNKVAMLTNGQEKVFLKERDNARHIQKNKENIQLKADQVWIQDKIDKTKHKIMQEVEIKEINLKRKSDDIDFKFSNVFDEIKVQIKETEKKTIWKIDECQKITVQKVNKEYVDSACNLFYEQIQKQLYGSQQEKLNNINLEINRNRDRIQQQDTQLDNLKKKQQLSLENLKKELYDTMVTDSNMSVFNKNMKNRLDDIKKDILNIESKGDPKEYYKKCQDLITIQQDQIFDQEKNNLKLKQIVTDFGVKISVMEEKISSANQVKQGLHQHDICQVDSEIQNVRNTIKDLKQSYQDNNTLTSQKLGAIEMNVLNTIANKKQENNQSLILKEDILFTVDRLYGPYNDKIRDVKNKQENIMYQIKELANHVQFKIT